MTKKERIVKLEKELEELKQRVSILEATRIIGVGISPDAFLPKPYDPFIYPTITWQNEWATWKDEWHS